MNRANRMKYLAIATCCMMLLSSCNLSRRGSGTDVKQGSSKVGSGVNLPTDATPEPEVTAAPAQNNSGAAKPAGTPKNFGGAQGKSTSIDLPTGEEAGQQKKFTYKLLNASTPKMVIEIDHVEGAAPDQKALDHFRSILASVSDKPGGIEFKTGQVIPKTMDRYGGADIESLVAKHRDVENDNDQVAAVYMIYVPGAFKDNSQVLGYASGSRIAMFPDSIEGASNPAVPRTVTERAVLVHEMGHILSLLNIGYKSPRPRSFSDKDPHHSKNKGSVMYPAIDSASVNSVLTGGPPTTFDADDKADLEDIKNGKL